MPPRKARKGAAVAAAPAKPKATGRTIEDLPIGAVVEHEALNRWRVKNTIGEGLVFGHGESAAEAVENFHLLAPPKETVAAA